jgi:5'-3' exonuclease
MAHGLKPLFSTSLDDQDIALDTIVFDVSYLAHRQAHALSRLQTSDGRLSGHIYGSFQFLRSVCYRQSPRRLVFCYDRRSSWRRHLLPTYKMTRTPVELDAAESWTPSPDVERLLRGFPGVHLACDGAEADDMVAWYVANNPLSTRDGTLAIVSADRDLWQLVDDQQDVAVIHYKKPKGGGRAKSKPMLLREKDVQQEFAVPATAVSRIKALLGDPSDCIEGIVGGSRPGKKDALRAFAVSAEADLYFDPNQPSAPVGPKVPDWLAPELVSQRPRMLVNEQITNLRTAVSRFQPTPHIQAEPNVASIMDVFIEFESENLLSQVKPFFDTLAARSR